MKTEALSPDLLFYVSGLGHGGAALVGNVYLEGTWMDQAVVRCTQGIWKWGAVPSLGTPL